MTALPFPMALRRLAGGLVLAWLAGLAAGGQAQSSGGPYTLGKQATAAGARASGGGYVLAGSAGEAAAEVQAAASYRLTSGFHTPRVAALPEALFANGFE